MPASHPHRTTLILWTAMLIVLPGVSAQTFVGASFQQTFTSTSTLDSPRGLSLSVGADRIWGPGGLNVGYHRVSQGSGMIAQTCGFDFDSCTPGPFDQSHSLETAELGLSLHPSDGSLASFTFGAKISLSWQAERLEHVDTREVLNKDPVGPDVGFGISTRVELSVIRKLHPFLSAQYDRILATDCSGIADAPCFDGRNVTRLGIGLLWRP